MGEGHQVLTLWPPPPPACMHLSTHTIGCGLLLDKLSETANSLFVCSLALVSLYVIEMNERCDSRHVQRLLQG